ncbi:MAG: hypothetical protein HY072_05045 [Deltaproteobacteria bacterium]|nr:hypothetical protein [Deltaproteobacteria bacterium]
MHCSLESILETLKQKKQTLALGTNLSSKAFILAKAFFELKKNLLVLCPNQDAAHELCLNLDIFCRKTVSSKSILEHFPTWDMSPYSSISSSIKTRLKRIRVLSSIIDNSEPKIIVTTIDAAFQSTIPKDLFLKYSLSLSASNKTPLSQPELISHLAQIGYYRVDTVEDCGTFSLKGNLLDVFVPQHDFPARVEFCGNEVEKIRFFEPSTQRTLQNSLINSIVVTPAREVLINNQTKSTLRERIKIHADESEIPRKIRDPVLLSIQDEIYSDHTDAWAPFAYEKPARFWDYLPDDLYIVWDEHEQCIMAWEGFLTEQKTLEIEAKNHGLILPDVSSLYGRPDELSFSKTILCFEKLEILNSDFYSNTTQHCISIQTNLDLTRREKHSFSEQENTIRGWLKEGFKILIVSSTQTQLERICFLLKERSLVYQIGDVRDAKANTMNFWGVAHTKKHLQNDLQLKIGLDYKPLQTCLLKT